MIKTGISHEKIAFMDIETANASKEIFELPASLAIAWQRLCVSRYKDEGDDYGALYKKYSPLYPEFGRIVCISIGWFTSATDFHVKAIYGENGDESSLLKQFINEWTGLSKTCSFLGGHNIKQFDIPFIIRRSLILNVSLNSTFDLYGKKPWDISQFVDTLEMWKVLGANMGSATLDAISAAFGFKSPKEEMDGSLVSTFYYLPAGPDYKKIGGYCNFDVVSCAAVYVRMTAGHNNFKVVENIS